MEGISAIPDSPSPQSFPQRIWARLWEKSAPDIDPIVPANDADSALLQANLDIAVGFTQRLVEIGIARASDLSKWLLATLLALNGGSAIAIANSDRLALLDISDPLRLFAAGTVFAVLLGMTGMSTLSVLGPSIGDLTTELIRCKIDNVYSAEAQKSQMELNRKSRIIGRVSLVLSLASLGCFISGVYFLDQLILLP